MLCCGAVLSVRVLLEARRYPRSSGLARFLTFEDRNRHVVNDFVLPLRLPLRDSGVPEIAATLFSLWPFLFLRVFSRF